MFHRNRLLFLFFLLFAVPLLSARVTRVEIASRSDVLAGQSFGNVGPYERITGRVYFSVAVANPYNQAIVDLANATNLHDGEVEFWSDFVAVRPKDSSKANGTLLLENPNRGRARILSLVDGGDEDLSTSAGDAWLLRNGFTVVALGWQWDATGPGALHLEAPIAKLNGNTITGLLRGDIMLAEKASDIPLGHVILGFIGGTEYPVADPADLRSTLTVRNSREGPRTVIPRDNWQFAHLVDGQVTPSDRHIYLKTGFEPGRIYEYTYAVKDPVVAGLGFAAVRDFAAYVKHNPDALTPAEHVIAEGISQNGRFLRDFLYQGFNSDEDGRIALDGVLAHVAGAGRGSFNFRFAQPSRDAQPTSSVFFPTDIFPFTDQPEIDNETHHAAGLLDRAAASHVVPKIFFSNTSYEYWGRVASLISTSAGGSRDAKISPDVRIYFFTGLQHFSGPFPPERGKGPLLGQLPQSPLPVRFFWRAMIANMNAWLRSGTAPPASSYPTRREHTLVAVERFSFPHLPGVHAPREANRAYHLDFGPRWSQGIITVQPPRVSKPFPVFVPKVDADGNERAGIHLPEIAVPLGTYTGWNFRDPSIGAPEQRLPFEGSFIPFSKDKDARKQAHDPRHSIAERYRGRQDYLRQFSHAVDTLIEQRWILPEDRQTLIERGAAEWDALVGP